PADLPSVEDQRPDWAGGSVLCIAGRGPFDGAATAMLAQLLEKHGLSARLEPDVAVASSNIVHLKSAGVKMICLSYFELGNSAAHLRYTIRRIRRQVPGASILAGLWGHERSARADEQFRANSGADVYALSLRQALSLCIEASSGGVDLERLARPDTGSSAA